MQRGFRSRAKAGAIGAERERDPALDEYMRALDAVPLLTAAQEQALAIRIQAGSPAPGAAGPITLDAHLARQQFAAANLPLVINIASQYTGQGVELADLIGAGNIGLMRAVVSYRPGGPARFAAYAVPLIRTACLRCAVAHVGIPEYLYLARWRVWRVEQDAEACGEPLSDAELCARAKVTPKHLAVIRGLQPAPLSLEMELHRARNTRDGYDALTLGETIADPRGSTAAETRERDELLDMLPRVMAERLTPRERLVITCRYGLGELEGHGKTFAEIAELLARVQPPKVSRETIRKIARDALATMAVAFGDTVDMTRILRMAQARAS